MLLASSTANSSDDLRSLAWHRAVLLLLLLLFSYYYCYYYYCISVTLINSRHLALREDTLVSLFFMLLERERPWFLVSKLSDGLDTLDRLCVSASFFLSFSLSLSLYLSISLSSFLSPILVHLSLYCCVMIVHTRKLYGIFCNISASRLISSFFLYLSNFLPFRLPLFRSSFLL